MRRRCESATISALISEIGAASESTNVADAGDLLENVGHAAGDGVHVREDEVAVVAEELRQRRGRAKAEHVEVARLKDALDHRVEGGEIQLVQRGADVLNVGLQHLVQYLRVPHVAGHFQPLRGGETVPDQLLQRLLQLGEAVVAERGGETNHGGFRNAHVLAQLRGRHERGLVIMGNNAFGDAPVALRQTFAAVVQSLQQLLRVVHWNVPPSGKRSV